MSSEVATPAEADGPGNPAAAPAVAVTPRAPREWGLWVAVGVAALALVACLLLWQKLGSIQEQLARQSADAGTNAIEARTLARQAQEQVRDVVARATVLETRLNEVALQRRQLEDLMQSLSLSRDENLVADIESALRLAQQQMQLTGSAEPVLAALRSADQRLGRTPQPRLARLRAAMARDADRIRAAGNTDVPALLARFDEVVRQVDELPVINAMPARGGQEPAHKAAPAAAVPPWWQRWGDAVISELRGLLRVSRIDQPEAMLLAPDQVFFLRENLKLRLLNARLSLLSRQLDTARGDVSQAAASLARYFDPGSRRTQAVATQLQQLQAQLRGAELPRIDESLAALAAAAGR